MEKILKDLRSENPEIRLSAVLRLGEFDKSNVEIVRALEQMALADKNLDVRGAALNELQAPHHQRIQRKISHLNDYVRRLLVEELDDWVKDALITPAAKKVLKGRLGVGPLPRAAPKPKPAPKPEPKPAAAPKKPAPEPVRAAPAPVTSSAKPKPVPAPKTKPVAAKPRPPAPRARPKPKRPPVDWAKAWEKTIQLIVSGALLRGILYLGAFMIVVSLTILVVRFWNIFPAFVQVGFIFSVPTAFYLAGWLVRGRMKLPQAGNVLSGVGALLVAVNFAAIYQLGGLAVDWALYWLITSLICTVVYALTAWKLSGQFFDYIVLIGGGNASLALTIWLGFLPAGSILGMMIYALALLLAAPRLWKGGDDWRDTALAVRYLPQALIPAALGAIVFLPGASNFARGAAFLMASLGYGWLAYHFPAAVYGHLTAWGLVAAVGFGLAGTELRSVWYASPAIILAAVYSLVRQGLASRLSEDFAQRSQYLAAATIVMTILACLAVMAGFMALAFDLWAGVCALCLSVLVFAGWSYLFERPVLLVLAAGLFIAPFGFSIGRWFLDANIPDWDSWLMVCLAGLAIAYLGVAALLRKSKNYAALFHLGVQVLIVIPGVWMLATADQTYSGWRIIPVQAAIGVMVLFYLVCAWLLHNGKDPGLRALIEMFLPGKVGEGIFLWALAVLLPVWLAVAWGGSQIQLAWLGVPLAGLGLVYTGVGQPLGKLKAAYRLPVRVLAYGLAAAGPLAASADQLALTVALYISVAVMLVLAALRRSTIELSIAALLFLLPFQLTLDLLHLEPHFYAFAYALLAAIGYVPLGLLMDRRQRKYALPLYAVGYGVSLLAIGLAAAGHFGAYPNYLAWVGTLTPLLVAGLYLYSTQYFGKLNEDMSTVFAWACVLVLVITLWGALLWANFSIVYQAVAWVVLGFAYHLAAHFLKRFKQSWLQTFHLPLELGSLSVSILGLGLTASASWFILLGVPVLAEFATGIHAIILAQTLGVGLAILAAGLRRERIFAHLASWLSFVPFTLALLTYTTLSIQNFPLAWCGLALVLLIIGFILDRKTIRWAHGPYMAGYVLLGYALVRSASNLLVNVQVMGILILVALISHLLVHRRWHRSYDDLIAFAWRDQDSLARSAFREAFLFISAYAFPVWLVQLLTYYRVPLAWMGLSLALVAPVYIGLGLALRRVDRTYTWPLYSAGYALTAIGAMLSFGNQALTIYVLGLNTIVYGLTAIIFRQAFWLYLSNTLLPVVCLLTLDYNDRLTAPWVASIFMGLSFLYIGTGWLQDRFYSQKKLAGTAVKISAFALPFYILGYLLSVLALGVAGAERMLAIYVYSAGVILYAASARVFRQAFFIYPAAWLAAVPYYLAVTLIPATGTWGGMVWLPLILAYIAIGRFVFQGSSLGLFKAALPVEARTQAPTVTLKGAFSQKATPFYLLAYALSINMIAQSAGDMALLTLAFSAATLLYLGSALLFRHPAWLYPGLLTAHFAIISGFTFRPSGSPFHYLSLIFLGVTWVMALLGYWISRRYPVARSRRFGGFVIDFNKLKLVFDGSPALEYLLIPSWAQPILLLTLVDLVIWFGLALYGYATGIIFSVGIAILLGLFAILWLDSWLVYGALFSLLLAIGLRLGWAGYSFAEIMAFVGGFGFVLYLLGRGLERLVKSDKPRLSSLVPWIKPLECAPILLTFVAVICTLPTTIAFPNATAASLAFGGALYLAIAYRGRYHRLGYLGMSMLLAAWSLALYFQDVRQPQFYAIPAAVYFTIVGFLEGRQGNRVFGLILEGFGLAVLLVTSFIQSLGDSGFAYFLLLLGEALLVIWWGAVRRQRLAFFTGIGFSVLNVLAQIIILVRIYQVNRWFVFLGVGLLLVVLAVFIERRREKLVADAKEWQDTLAAWN
ncbi:SCO7613 C-terminal domain-containing membrane protein [Chloroflexota bacterium]